MTQDDAREALVQAMRRMHESGLNRGTSGNASIRVPGGMMITPSGIPPASLDAASMVFVNEAGHAEGALKPSSEFRMHHRILARRPDAQGVMHCHSRFATVLACCGRPIEPIHYMILVAGARHIPVAPFATFGTENLANAVLDSMGEGKACLMANHGQIAIGATWQQALAIAEEVEEQAAITFHTLQLGGARTLTAEQLAASEAQFLGYGQGASATPE